MWIPPFWCGVIATLLAEGIGFIAVVIHLNRKYNNDNRKSN